MIARREYPWLIIGLSVTLAGCLSSNPETLAMTSTSPLLQTPAPVSTPSVVAAVPGITVLPTSTPIGPTPVLPLSTDTDFFLDDLFFGSAAPNCQLPCWQGLVVGQSSMADVQRMFDTTFDFQGKVDFAQNNPLQDKNEVAYFKNISSVFYTGYIWKYPNSQIYVVALVNSNMNILDGLVIRAFVSDPLAYKVHLTVQSVLRQLGTPNVFMAQLSQSEAAEVGGANILMVYQKGLVFEFTSSIPIVLPSQDPSLTRATAQFCLQDNEIKRDNFITGGESSAEIVLMPPLIDNFNDLSPVQSWAVQPAIRKNNPLLPISNVFGVTVEEITRRALNEDNPCLYGNP
jgi:hypothetical protein